MNIVRLVFNPLQENTYVVWDETRECIIIDAGNCSDEENQRLATFITEQQLHPVMTINTHGHFDHTLGVAYVAKTYNTKVAVSSQDAYLADYSIEYCRMFGLTSQPMPATDIDLDTADSVCFGNTTLQVIKTPGHTPGGVVLYHEPSHSLFTGDTLFAGSIGRTDLPKGDYSALMNSILKNIIPLGDEVTIYPGHGEKSTIGQESLYNPFVTEALNGEVKY